MSLFATVEAPLTFSLESRIERLSMEAQTASSISEVFSGVLPGLLGVFQDAGKVISSMAEPAVDMAALVKNYLSFKPQIKFSSFSNHSSILIPVPEGFQGDMLDYGKDLVKLSLTVYADTLRALEDYNVALASFISNKDDKISAKSNTEFFGRIEDRRNTASKIIAGYFPGKTDSSRIQFGQAYRRFTDLEGAVENAKDLDQMTRKQNLSAITKLVDKITANLDVVIRNFKLEEYQKVSGPSAVNVSRGAYEVAKMVEFLSVLRFRTDQYIATVDASVKTLDKAV